MPPKKYRNRYKRRNGFKNKIKNKNKNINKNKNKNSKNKIIKHNSNIIKNNNNTDNELMEKQRILIEIRKDLELINNCYIDEIFNDETSIKEKIKCYKKIKSKIYEINQTYNEIIDEYSKSSHINQTCLKYLQYDSEFKKKKGKKICTEIELYIVTEYLVSNSNSKTINETNNVYELILSNDTIQKKNINSGNSNTNLKKKEIDSHNKEKNIKQKSDISNEKLAEIRKIWQPNEIKRKNRNYGELIEEYNKHSIDQKKNRIIKPTFYRHRSMRPYNFIPLCRMIHFTRESLSKCKLIRNPIAEAAFSPYLLVRCEFCKQGLLSVKIYQHTCICSFHCKDFICANCNCDMRLQESYFIVNL